MNIQITVVVSVRNSNGGTNARRVEVSLNEWNANRDETAAAAGREVVGELERIDTRNDRVRTWTVEDVRETRV